MIIGHFHYRTNKPEPQCLQLQHVVFVPGPLAEWGVGAVSLTRLRAVAWLQCHSAGASGHLGQLVLLGVSSAHLKVRCAFYLQAQ